MSYSISGSEHEQPFAGQELIPVLNFQPEESKKVRLTGRGLVEAIGSSNRCCRSSYGFDQAVMFRVFASDAWR